MSTPNPSVNRPVDPKVRDQDIENKLRLYGIYNGFANGKVPSNRQIDIALNSFLNSRALRSPSQRLSAEGRVLVEDFRNVVEEAKMLLLTKNHDQALQEFIWHTEQLGARGTAPGTVKKPEVPLSKDQANRDAQDALDGLRALGTLILSNGQFRKLLNDATILFRDIAGDAATKAARRVQPSEDQLSQIDQPEEDNVWHEVPKFSKEDVKARLNQEKERNKPISRGELREVASNATATAHPEDSTDPRDTTRRIVNDQRYGTDNGVDARTGFRTAYNDVVDRVQSNVPDEHQDRAKENWSRSREYWNEKMPEDRRQQTIFRLKKMVVEIQGHQEYQRAIDTLLTLAENYRGHGKITLQESHGQFKGAHKDDHLTQAEKYLRVLIERFANYTSLDDLIEAINDIYKDADRDPELKSWFRSMDAYIRRALKQTGYIMTEDATREWDQLNDHGHFLLRERYREHTDRVVNEVKFIGQQFAEDPDSRRLGNAMQKLFTDLGTDDDGKPVFKKHLVKDISSVILPAVFENIRYVPVPRIEYSDTMIDAVIENLVLESDNLMPNIFEIGNQSHFRWGRKTVSNKHKQQFMVHVSGIQCDLRDISYYINRKQGFPKIVDTGVMDVFLAGEGLSFTLQLGTVDKADRANFYKVEKCNVSLQNMNIKLKQSKHKLLFTVVKPLLLKVVRPVLTKVIEKQIQDYFAKLDAFAYRIYREQERVKAQLKDDPENTSNVYARYYNAFQAEVTSQKEKAKEITADKKLNVAVTKHDSIFKEISLPGGISTKATEYKSMSQKGDRWGSDVFALGSGAETRNIPRPIQVTRRSPHRHQKATVKDRSDHGTLSSQYSRASRDSGYHGNEPTQHPASFGNKLMTTDEYGTHKSALEGGYTLNAPAGTNPMIGTGNTVPVAPLSGAPPANKGGYYPTATAL